MNQPLPPAPSPGGEAVACAACGGRRREPLFRGLCRCADCGMVYYPRRLGAEEAAGLYGDEYFNGDEYFDYVADRRAHRANFRARVRQLSRFLPAGRSVFEVGCSYGFFLDLARARWRVAGCDVAEGPCRYAREELGLPVRCADFAELPLSRGQADAFCMWDTVEHLPDPAGYLARMADLLEPGGLVALTTGDIGSWLARRRGERWRQIHPPTHLWYFSAESMRRTLARFGFEVVCCRHVGMWRSVGQISYSLTGHRARPSRLHRFVMWSGLGRRCVWLNTFDLMFVVARRAARPAGCARGAA